MKLTKAIIERHAPEMLVSLADLLEWAKGNRGSKHNNPYTVPEVKQALQTIAKITGEKDWLYVDTKSIAKAEGK